jgi:hypothetical protein
MLGLVILLGIGARARWWRPSFQRTRLKSFRYGSAALHAPHGDADAGRAPGFPDVHLHLCHPGGEEPAGRDGSDPDPGCSPISSDLGYLSFTVVFFVSLFPGNVQGPELAAIFAIFTSQAWNMAFSFYQSLRTVPTDLDEAAAFAHQPGSASGAWKSRSRCRASSGICAPSLAAPRSRIFARATSTGPMPVWIVRAGP